MLCNQRVRLSVACVSSQNAPRLTNVRNVKGVLVFHVLSLSLPLSIITSACEPSGAMVSGVSPSGDRAPAPNPHDDCNRNSTSLRVDEDMAATGGCDAADKSVSESDEDTLMPDEFKQGRLASLLS